MSLPFYFQIKNRKNPLSQITEERREKRNFFSLYVANLCTDAFLATKKCILSVRTKIRVRNHQNHAFFQIYLWTEIKIWSVWKNSLSLPFYFQIRNRKNPLSQIMKEKREKGNFFSLYAVNLCTDAFLATKRYILYIRTKN